MLFRPDAFEPLTDTPWDEGRVRDAMRDIVADADRAFDAHALWPADDWDGWMAPTPMKNLYVGAAGVIWALEALRRRGHAASGLDLRAAAERALAAWREEPDFQAGAELPAHKEASLLCGETGLLLVALRIDPSTELEEALLARVREGVDDETNDLMWGTPGTLLAARAMVEWTGGSQWRDAWRESADALLARRDPDGLWTQRLHGGTSRGLGPPHGAVGNVLSLLQGGELLDPKRRAALEHETAQALRRNAVVEHGRANWPLDEGTQLVSEGDEIRVQWCYGGPGVVISAASYLDEELVLAGAELAWEAGPPGMAKGPCICHGTAGNGYSFLAAFARTGDERWLERARRFAVHALEQVERGRDARGRGRYSLWTGDVGVALYAADCLDSRTTYPVVGSLDW